MPKITIYDIAKEANISPSTVSRILRGGDGHVYPEATRQRVAQIAKRLNYRPNAVARLLSQNNSTMIGVAVHFTEHPYLNRFLAAIRQEISRHGYTPTFMDAQYLADSNIPAFPPAHMLAGFISPGLDLQRDWPPYYEEIAHYAPIISLQPVSQEAAKIISVVQTDFADGYLQAGTHLMELGHRHIAYLGGITQLNPSESAKRKGWLNAAESLGISSDYSISWDYSELASANSSKNTSQDYLYQPDSQQTIKEVVAKLASFPQKITALICSSDEVAVSLQSYLQSQGWRLPQRLSIIGYDGISMGEQIYPSLTTIAPDYEHMAQIAVTRLLAMIESKKSGKKETAFNQVVPPQLIIRGSTYLLK